MLHTSEQIINSDPDHAASLPVAGTVLTPGKQQQQRVMISRLSIIIPAYNEENTITTILDRINEVKLISNFEKEVIIVDDCSKDRTGQVIQEYMSSNSDLTISYFKYLRHDIN